MEEPLLRPLGRASWASFCFLVVSSLGRFTAGCRTWNLEPDGLVSDRTYEDLRQIPLLL